MPEDNPALEAFKFQLLIRRTRPANENELFDALSDAVQDILTDPDYRFPDGRPPRYDEVFYLGTAWLDSLANGGQATTQHSLENCSEDTRT